MITACRSVPRLVLCATLLFSGFAHSGESRGRSPRDEFVVPQFSFVVSTSDGFPVAGIRIDASYFVDTFDSRRSPIYDSWFKCLIGYQRPHLEKRKLRTDSFHTDDSGSVVVSERRELLPPELKVRASDNIEITTDTLNLGLQIPFTASNGQSVYCGMPVPPLGAGGLPLRDALSKIHTASLLQPEYRISLAVSRTVLDEFEQQRMDVCRGNAEILLRSHPTKLLPEVIDSRYPLSRPLVESFTPQSF